VVAVSPEVAAAGRIQCGDRVAGLADGMEGLRPQSGAFAEYVSVDGGMCFKMPPEMTFAEGASMPLRIVTACMALFGSLEVPSELLQNPTTKDKLTVLVYGGATSTGTAAIQLLSRCGVNVITTCSAGSMAMVESYGADKCFDYNEASCGDDIRSYTGNALDYALDCITTESSVKICYRALGRCGGKCKSSAVNPDYPVNILNGR
jgi:NADPH:quinone reductase-like Zn-dependent oxidoreductase